MGRVKLFLSLAFFIASLLSLIAGYVLIAVGQGLWGAALCFTSMFLILAFDFSRPH